MYVYFIRAGNRGAIKIGCAENVQKRLDQLQVGNAFRLNVLATIPCSSMNEAKDLEAMLHKHFKKQRIRGEWFMGTIKLTDSIKTINGGMTEREKEEEWEIVHQANHHI